MRSAERSASDTALRFVTYVVQAGQSLSVQLTFLSTPGRFPVNQKLFSRVPCTVDFRD